ncbi:BatD family protein [Paraburkholderia sp. IW21]|uniref:BatD family protein n=1 Tax=Paraburkholderia sp. IW21 TaxID=3242488 RepID=UPI003520BF1A
MTAVFVRLLLIVTWLGSASAAAFADPAPQTRVRAHLEPAGPVVAGSEVKLVVDLLTTTWFTEAPNWPLFTVADAIVSLPDEQADNLSEEIDGVHWFGVSRAYRIAPQAGKTYDIAPFAITVYPGGTNTPVQVMTPALKLVTTLPPGAQGMTSFFPTSGLTATQKIEPPKQQLRVGDSITRTITQSAAGTESMLIPPVSLGEVDGLKRYARPSTTRNIVRDRVGLVAGERTDSVTYIADHNGRFKLPPVTIEWWNTATQKRETIVLPGVTFSAAAAHEKPLFDIPVDAMSQGFPHRIIVIHSRQLIAGFAIVLGLIGVVWARVRIATFLRRMRMGASEVHKRYLEGDAVAWRRLCAIARQGDWRRTIPALYRWMDRTRDFGHPARLASIPRADDAGVAELVEAVTAHYAGTAAPDLRWEDAETALRQAGKRTRLQREEMCPLPPLNNY